MYTATRFKPYREAIVFSPSELLFMEIRSLILFGEIARPWWNRLSAIEKYRILQGEKSNTQIVHYDDKFSHIQEL